jgi:hypothetical protein
VTDDAMTLVTDDEMTLRLFAVRTIDGKEPVGFFWVRLTELIDCIDAVCDPKECEYKLIDGPTYICWANKECWKMGVKEISVDDGATEVARDAKVLEGLAFDGESFSTGTPRLRDFLSGVNDVEGWGSVETLIE